MPTNQKLYSQIKSEAKAKFGDDYPSAGSRRFASRGRDRGHTRPGEGRAVNIRPAALGGRLRQPRRSRFESTTALPGERAAARHGRRARAG